jgi:hypothetical protein
MSIPGGPSRTFKERVSQPAFCAEDRALHALPTKQKNASWAALRLGRFTNRAVGVEGLAEEVVAEPQAVEVAAERCSRLPAQG